MDTWIRAVVVAVIATTAIPEVTFGQQPTWSGSSAPRFEDYRVAIIPPIAKRNTEAIVDRDAGESEIRKVAGEGPDFAGRYAVVKWSCGSGCSSIVIVNVRTGRIYSPPFLGASRCGKSLDTPLLSYKFNSSLLIVRGSLEIPDRTNNTFSDGSCGVFYYVWSGRGLKLIHSVSPEKGVDR
jgi:hypothetical protein